MWLSVLSLNNLKLNKTNAVENICIQEKFIIQLTFNPGLALAGFRTTRPCMGQFPEGPNKFSHSESRLPNLKPYDAELFYSRVLNRNRGSLHTRSFTSLSLDIDQLKMAFWARKVSGALRNGTRPRSNREPALGQRST